MVQRGPLQQLPNNSKATSTDDEWAAIWRQLLNSDFFKNEYNILSSANHHNAIRDFVFEFRNSLSRAGLTSRRASGVRRIIPAQARRSARRGAATGRRF
jgi:hypothetical protein